MMKHISSWALVSVALTFFCVGAAYGDLKVSVVPNPKQCGGNCPITLKDPVVLQITNHWSFPEEGKELEWTSSKKPESGSCVLDWVPAAGKVLVPPGATVHIPITLTHNPDCPRDGSLIDFYVWEQGLPAKDAVTQFVVVCEEKKVPAMPVWGLVGLVVLTAIGGAILVGRRRASATRAA